MLQEMWEEEMEEEEEGTFPSVDTPGGTGRVGVTTPAGKVRTSSAHPTLPDKAGASGSGAPRRPL